MNNPGSSTTGNKPTPKKTATSTTAASTTASSTTVTRPTGTGTNANSTGPEPRIVEVKPPGTRIVIAEPRSRPGATGSATRPPASPSGPPGLSARTLDNIVSSLAKALDDKTYAIIGRAAHALLNIGPSDLCVDVLVPPGASLKRAEKLCTSHTTIRFRYDVSKKEVFYVRENGTKDIPIRFWEPKAVRQECPQEMADLVMVGDVRVLKPTLLLNIHCHMWLKAQSGPGRGSGNGAAQSIDLLLRHIAQQTKTEVSNATGEFIIKFAAAKPEVHAGFRDLGIQGPN